MLLLQDSSSDDSLFLFLRTDLWKWKKIYIWPVIKYFVKKDMKAKEIHADFQNTLRDSTLPYSTVALSTNKWASGRLVRPGPQWAIMIIYIYSSWKIFCLCKSNCYFNNFHFVRYNLVWKYVNSINIRESYRILTILTLIICQNHEIYGWLERGKFKILHGSDKF